MKGKSWNGSNISTSELGSKVLLVLRLWPPKNLGMSDIFIYLLLIAWYRIIYKADLFVLDMKQVFIVIGIGLICRRMENYLVEQELSRNSKILAKWRHLSPTHVWLIVELSDACWIWSFLFFIIIFFTKKK